MGGEQRVVRGGCRRPDRGSMQDIYQKVVKIIMPNLHENFRFLHESYDIMINPL
jgi:hypothetical protein